MQLNASIAITSNSFNLLETEKQKVLCGLNRKGFSRAGNGTATALHTNTIKMADSLAVFR